MGTRQFLHLINTNVKLLWKNDQGVHTTSTSSLYELPGNRKIIDSPGMRDIEITKYPKDKIISGFKEILEGKHDEIAAQDFNMVGTIDEVVARHAERQKANAGAGA